MSFVLPYFVPLYPMDMNQVLNIAVSGSCDSRGRGTWGLYCSNFDYLRTGTDSQTSNNRMEILAVCAAMDYLLRGIYKMAIIRSSSNSVVNGILKHLPVWEENGFEGVKDADLWQLISYRLKQMKLQDREAEFIWFRSDSTEPAVNKVRRCIEKARIKHYDIVENKFKKKRRHGNKYRDEFDFGRR